MCDNTKLIIRQPISRQMYCNTRTIIDESLIQSAKIEATTTAITITTTTTTTYDHSIHTYIISLSVSTTTTTTYDHSIHTYITSL